METMALCRRMAQKFFLLEGHALLPCRIPDISSPGNDHARGIVVHNNSALHADEHRADEVFQEHVSTPYFQASFRSTPHPPFTLPMG